MVIIINHSAAHIMELCRYWWRCNNELIGMTVWTWRADDDDDDGDGSRDSRGNVVK